MNTFITLTLPGKTELSQANLPVVFLLLSEDAGLELGLPSGARGEESACQRKRCKRWGLIPGSGRSSGEGMATHSSILAWRIPWMEEPSGLQSMGSQRDRHD